MNNELKIKNKNNEFLVGNIHKTDTKDLIIVCHGLGRSKDDEFIRKICESFSKKGINAFRFNFSGVPPSEGKPEDSYYTKQTSDLGAVIDYFIKEGYKIKSLIGHSIGSISAIIQAAKNGRINSLILIAPRIIALNSIIVRAIKESGETLSQIIESSETVYPYKVEIKDKTGEKSKIYSLSKEYLKELRDIKIIDYLKRINIPILIFRGTKDNIVDKQEIKEGCRANKLTTYIPIEGAGHTFNNLEHQDILIFKMLQWCDNIKSKNCSKYFFIGPYVFIFLVIFIDILSLIGECLNYILPYISVISVKLDLSFGDTIVILTLMSMLVLSYVPLINRLDDILQKNSGNIFMKISWPKAILSMTVGMFYITTFSLILRIIYLSFLCRNTNFVDFVILISFFLGTFMRMVIFFDSYGENFKSFCKFWRYWR